MTLISGDRNQCNLSVLWPFSIGYIVREQKDDTNSRSLMSFFSGAGVQRPERAQLLYFLAMKLAAYKEAWELN